MESKMKMVNLKNDNSKTIIMLLSAVIVILVIALVIVASQKNKSVSTNGNVSSTESTTQYDYASEIESYKRENEELSSKVDELNKQISLKHKVTTQPDTSNEGAENVKTIYLTFDDGPSPYTPEILEILDKYGVKATFFVINTSYNQYMKDIVDHGHTIALHSYTHDYKTIYTSEEAYYNDLQKISDVVYDETGVRTKIIRFPGGGSNTVSRKYCNGIMSKVTKGVQEKGYFYHDWNISSGDADGNNIPVDRLIANCKKVPSSNTVVVLMHDTKAKRTTVDALPTIIENYKAMGYKFDLITSSTPAIHHGVNN